MSEDAERTGGLTLLVLFFSGLDQDLLSDSTELRGPPNVPRVFV